MPEWAKDHNHSNTVINTLVIAPVIPGSGVATVPSIQTALNVNISLRWVSTTSIKNDEQSDGNRDGVSPNKTYPPSRVDR